MLAKILLANILNSKQVLSDFFVSKTFSKNKLFLKLERDCPRFGPSSVQSVESGHTVGKTDVPSYTGGVGPS